jgi:hypothetical protein
MRQRYADDVCKQTVFTKPLIILTRIALVPVVGLEPTRLVKGPGF